MALLREGSENSKDKKSSYFSSSNCSSSSTNCSSSSNCSSSCSSCGCRPRGGGEEAPSEGSSLRPLESKENSIEKNPAAEVYAPQGRCCSSRLVLLLQQQRTAASFSPREDRRRKRKKKDPAADSQPPAATASRMERRTSADTRQPCLPPAAAAAGGGAGVSEDGLEVTVEALNKRPHVVARPRTEDEAETDAPPETEERLLCFADEVV
ncbi:hypothetical protein Efla_002039 [Eimeria flavescens]